MVTAGLPATGKSTIAEVVGNRLGLPVLSVDPIEAAILSAGIDSAQPTGLAAYLVAETMAEGVLASGRGVVIDAVNAVEPAREQWVKLAARQDATLRFIEVVCSDPEVHRERLAARAGRHAKTEHRLRRRAEPRRVGAVDRASRPPCRASPSTRCSPSASTSSRRSAFLAEAECSSCFRRPRRSGRAGSREHGSTTPRSSWPELTPQRRAAVDGVRRLSRNLAAATGALRLGGTQAAEVARNRVILTSPTMPAIDRYDGVLYEALDAATLSTPISARSRDGTSRSRRRRSG